VGGIGKILLVAPVLPADVLATARILDTAGLLELLITRGVLAPPLAGFLRSLGVTRSFSGRPASPVTSSRTDAKWCADFVFYITFAITQSRTRATDASFAFLDRIAEKRVRSPMSAVFAREDCCVKTFRRAKKLGIRTIYQLPTAYWRLVRELMEREMGEFPGICTVAEDPYEFAPNRTERKTAELDLADCVLCPSTFVYQSLVRYRVGSYRVIPFAVDAPRRINQTTRKPVFLYAGNITMRKGIHRLLLAWKRLKAYQTHELRLIGDMFLSKKFLDDFHGMFTHISRTSPEQLDQHYGESSVFVFNSVADGFGQVILEAMSNCLPVIASRNCGAPEIIEDRREGLLVDYGCDDQLANALEWALSCPTELAEMGRHALEKIQRWTWENYAAEFLNWLQPIVA
jgi:glycosyltransferase involved in cell wall biosynthesis